MARKGKLIAYPRGSPDGQQLWEGIAMLEALLNVLAYVHFDPVEWGETKPLVVARLCLRAKSKKSPAIRSAAAVGSRVFAHMWPAACCASRSSRGIVKRRALASRIA